MYSAPLPFPSDIAAAAADADAKGATAEAGGLENCPTHVQVERSGGRKGAERSTGDVVAAPADAAGAAVALAPPHPAAPASCRAAGLVPDWWACFWRLMVDGGGPEEESSEAMAVPPARPVAVAAEPGVGAGVGAGVAATATMLDGVAPFGDAATSGAPPCDAETVGWGANAAEGEAGSGADVAGSAGAAAGEGTRDTARSRNGTGRVKYCLLRIIGVAIV